MTQKFGRIKGANSDYKYEPDQGQIVEVKDPEELELSIFICPHRQPSAVDQHDGQNYCVGTDQGCPSDRKTGHALVKLHQDNGVLLQSHQSKLEVGKPSEKNSQQHNIVLTPESSGQVVVEGALSVASPSFTLSVNEQGMTIAIHQPTATQPAGSQPARSQPAGSQPATAQPSAAANTSPQVIFQITLNQNGLTVAGPQDAALSMGKDGGIQLKPGAGSGVKILGKLDVTGELTVQGSPVLPASPSPPAPPTPR